MACDTAFRIIARRHLDAVIAQHDGTCRGDPEALHQIRIALTHLGDAIRFFSPMVDDALRPNVWAELKWLNGQLGMVRDLDVAIERVVAESGDELAVVAKLQHWGRETGREPPAAGARAAIRTVPPPGRADLDVDRKRPLVDPAQQGKPFDCAAARSPTTRRSG
jgi:Uncharacterized conserved protein, COG5607